MILTDPTLQSMLVVAALLLDGLIGDPPVLWRTLRHPVVAMGAAIDALRRHLNRPDEAFEANRLRGAFALLAVVALSAGAGFAVEWAAWKTPVGPLFIAVAAAILIAQKSLYQHVARVRDGLNEQGLAGGRQALGQIVGRRTENLDQPGIVRAAIESLAENFADGVVAPAFWFALLGLPGLAAYKAINTADSMIGHTSAELRSFGWAAARLDDLVNWIPARLAALLLTLAAPLVGGSVPATMKVVVDDARRHRSPNAGWPEAAAAGALGIALAGPRQYREGRVEDPFLNATGRLDAVPADIQRALRLLIGACTLHGFGYLVLAALA